MTVVICTYNIIIKTRLYDMADVNKGLTGAGEKGTL